MLVSRSPQHGSRPSRSPGFTLIEVLVVVGLIATLVTLVFVVSGSVMRGTRQKATVATITKVDGMLKDRLRAIDIAMESKQFYQEVRQLEARVKNLPGGTPQQKKALIKVIPALILKSKKRNFFPQPSSGTPADNAEVLYEMLTSAEVFGITPASEDDFNSNELADTDGDGKMELIDAWGQPLRFYLYPTRAIRPGGLAAADALGNSNGTIEENERGLAINTELAAILFPSLSDLAIDPEDPGDSLLLIANTDNNGFNKAESWTNQQFQRLSDAVRGTHTLSTNHQPLIVSAGPDGDLGLFEPSDRSNFGHLAQPVDATDLSPIFDNITNYQTPGK